MNSKAVTILVLIIIIILGIVLYNRSGNDAPVDQNPVMTATTTDNTPTATDLPATSTDKTFTVTGKPFSFTPATITVNKGDRVTIVFKNAQGTHDWKLDEFNAATKVLQAGQEETITFVADKTGSFEYYCSVGEHRQMGMKGTLIVK